MVLFRDDKLEGLRGKDLVKLDLARYNVEVEDADTILLRQKGLIGYLTSPLAIRMAGVDAPEIAQHSIWDYKSALFLGPMGLSKDQPHAQEAKEWLEERVKRSKGLVAYISPDQETYGRYVGVLGDDLANINLQLLQYGQATALPYGPRSEDILDRRVAEERASFARENQIGLWNYARYQVQHQTVGTSLTHNQLMRAEEEGNAYTRYQAGKLGLYGNSFSARDDNYNTIEALGHSGIAPFFRRQLTPFGSGFNPGDLSSLLKRSYVVFDIETTGKEADVDEPIDLAAIRYLEGKEVERFQTYIKPRVAIEAGAQEVHKLSPEFINTVGQDLKPALSAFERFIGDSPLVGHNIKGFDLPIINRVMEEVLNRKLTNPVVDTLSAARKLIPGEEQYSLEYLAKRLGFTERPAHQALTDVETTGDLVQSLLSRVRPPSKAAVPTPTPVMPKKGFKMASHGLLGVGITAGLLGTAWIGGHVLNKVFGNPADYNSIEGLSSGPFAQLSKKSTGVDFESPWNAMRKWAQKLGMTADELYQSHGFQQALEKAVPVNKLGEGAFGVVYKMKTSFLGREFHFARKLAKTPEAISPQEVQYMRELSGMFTADVYRSHTNIDPSLRGVSPKGNKDYGFIDMELLEGKELAKTPLGEVHELLPQARKQMERAHKLGYAHGDSHMGNFMAVKTPKGETAFAIADLGGMRHKNETAEPFITQFAQEARETLGDYGKQKIGARAKRTPKSLTKRQQLARRESVRMQSIMSQGAQQHNRLQGAITQPTSLAILDDPFNKR